MLNHVAAILRNFTAKPLTKFLMIHLSILLNLLNYELVVHKLFDQSKGIH